MKQPTIRRVPQKQIAPKLAVVPSVGGSLVGANYGVIDISMAAFDEATYSTVWIDVELNLVQAAKLIKVLQSEMREVRKMLKGRKNEKS
jgi:hypothetical protein